MRLSYMSCINIVHLVHTHTNKYTLANTYYNFYRMHVIFAKIIEHNERDM